MRVPGVLSTLTLCSLMALATTGFTQAAVGQEGVPGARQPYRFESSGQLILNNKRVRYRALVEETFVTGPEGHRTASLVSTSYFRENAGDQRPVLFVFNGGPGSAGLWLQMGLVGPRRVDFDDDINPPTVPPFKLADNTESILDIADVVIFDPPGTGFSRVLPGGKPEEFFGTRQDARLTLEFVGGWIQRHRRFNSPRFLMGESYGTIRAAAVARLMAGGPFGSGSMDAITLNGVILLGQAMGGNPGEAALANTLPSLAATAWFHGKVDDTGQSLEDFVAQAREFAASDYVEALYAGQRLPAADKAAIAGRIAELTGLSAEFVLANDLRVSTTAFTNQLLADQGLQVGKYDARFVLPLASSGNDPVADDPAMGQYVPGFVAAINLHMRDELGVDIDEPYLPIEFHKVNGRWDYGAGPGVHIPGRQDEDLAVAMRRNPNLRVFFGSGWYDLVTTVGSTEYLVAHSDYPADRVILKNYASGHMPYLGEESRKRLSADLRQFISEAAGL